MEILLFRVFFSVVGVICWLSLRRWAFTLLPCPAQDTLTLLYPHLSLVLPHLIDQYLLYIIMTKQMIFIGEPDSTLITFLVCPELITRLYLFSLIAWFLYVLIRNSAPKLWPVRNTDFFLSPARTNCVCIILLWISANALTFTFIIIRSLGLILFIFEVPEFLA